MSFTRKPLPFCTTACFSKRTLQPWRVRQCPLLTEGGSIHIEKYNVCVPPGVVGLSTLSVDLLKVTQLSKPNLQLQSQHSSTKPHSSTPENALLLRFHIKFSTKVVLKEVFKTVRK